MAEARVCAVVVTYRPDAAALARLLGAVRPQVALLVVVDNASPGMVAALLAGRADAFLPQRENVGLAAGLNAGIAWARAQGASHVILFDQDSAPAPGMVAALLDGEARLLALGRPVAAVGPRYTDVKSGEKQPVIGSGGWYLRRKTQPDFQDFLEAGYLITSGTLIRAAALDQVGAMREDLFIDGVDIEWCLRAAKTHGLYCYAVDAAWMAHDLGDAVVRLGPVTRALHSPLRDYYIVRNALLLMRSPDVPLRWKAGDLLKTLRRLAAFPLLSRKPLQELKWLGRALRDGLCGKAGRARYFDQNQP